MDNLEQKIGAIENQLTGIKDLLETICRLIIEQQKASIEGDKLIIESIKNTLMAMTVAISEEIDSQISAVKTDIQLQQTK